MRSIVLALFLLTQPAIAWASIVPSPEEHLGRPVAEDGVLFDWETILGYLRVVDDASPRLRLIDLGTSTLGKPFVVAVVSDFEGMERQEELLEWNRSLLDVDATDEQEARRIAREGRAIVAFSLGVHSTEVGASQASMEMLYELVTREDELMRRVRERLVVLVVPSMNPDGLDIVQQWYDQTKGTEAEGSYPVELYHPYAGHDNNRDGFFNNLDETAMWSRLLYQDWLPQMVVDEHQMGSGGPRLFLPPFDDPISPSVHPLVYAQISAAGQQAVSDLTAAGWKGVATSTIFTGEWPGSVRSTGFWHNMLGILSEVASARLATPLHHPEGSLSGWGRGLPEYERRANFLEPWPGGWWRLRDIVDLELDLTWSLLRWASDRKEDLVLNFWRMNKDAVEQGRSEAPFAFVLPCDQFDPGAVERCVEILRSGGVRAELVEGPLDFGDHRVEGRAWVVRADQPFRPFILEMLGRVEYPRVEEGGEVVRPYDVTAWRLADLLGVKVLTVEDRNELAAFPAPLASEDFTHRPLGSGAWIPAGQLRGHAAALAVHRQGGRIDRGPTGDWSVHWEGGDLGALLDASGVRAGTARPLDGSSSVHPARVALFSPWGGSMDEGWTRLVLDRFGFGYERIRPGEPALTDPESGRRLRRRFDVVIVPSIAASILESGVQGEGLPRVHEPVWPERYRRGWGRVEVGQALRAFVEEGGTLVAISASVPWTVEQLGLPVSARFGPGERGEVYAPGSLLRARIDATHPLAFGMPATASVYFANGYGLRPLAWSAPTRVVARYAERETVVAGYVEGERELAGVPAVLEIPLGQGRVVLFGFHPQRRAQSEGTFPLLLNALWVSGP